MRHRSRRPSVWGQETLSCLVSCLHMFPSRSICDSCYKPSLIFCDCGEYLLGSERRLNSKVGACYLFLWALGQQEYIYKKEKKEHLNTELLSSNS